MQSYKFLILFLIFQSLINLGCSNSFLSLKEISDYNTTTTKKHSFIFFNKNYVLNKDYELTEQKHFLLKIGGNLNSIPDVLYVYDSAVMKLEDFDARIIKKNGSEKTYSKGDLQTYNLSSRRIISKSYLKYIPAFEQLATGDIIEVVYSHIHSLPSLGLEFTLDELDVPANNILLSISFPEYLNLKYKTVNNFPKPKVITLEDSKVLTFSIDNYKKANRNFIFGRKNSEPGVFISIPDNNKADFSWKDFGDWYLNLIDSKIKSAPEIDSLAENITKDLDTSEEKLEAIFNYCQKNIRYEQVYLARGEFIPNDCKTILSRKYGDCKDYSTIIYTLAKSAGLNPNLALCYRGRGREFFEDIPVDQFNHVIVYYNDGEKDFWFDGTNRIGIPGITTSDLINQEALILEKENSRLKIIEENSSNLLSLKGKLKATNKNLNGSLSIELLDQYAIEFFYLNLYLNAADMGEYIATWIKNNLSESVILNKMNWKEEDKKFSIEIECEIPNSISIIEDNYYTSLTRIFPKLFPSVDIGNEEIFYYPFYNKVNIDIPIVGLRKNNVSKNYNLKIDYYIPPGPFNNEDKSQFADQFVTIKAKFNNKIKLIKAD